ncbi:MAG: HD domain-containing phosphohydrolase [Deferrisomatales bacterium]
MSDAVAWCESFFPGARVLVVDGDDESRRRLCDELRRMGHAPLPFFSGEAALETLAETDPDLVLADARLPGLDGFALCRTMKSTPRWRDTPIFLAVDGSDPAEACTRALDCGADDCVTKPAPSAELRARIDRSLAARDRVRFADAAEHALNTVVRGAEDALQRLRAGPLEPGLRLGGLGARVLTCGGPQQLPEALLYRERDTGLALLYRREAGGQVSERRLEGLGPCLLCGDAAGPWVRRDVVWDGHGGPPGSAELDQAVGPVRNYVHAAVIGGCVSAVNLAGGADRLDARRLQGLAAHAGCLDAASVRVAAAEGALDHTLGVLARACEGEFVGPDDHARRMGAFAGALAEALGLAAELGRQLALAARLHDVGKVRVPRALLEKQGPLTVPEFEVVKHHTTWGAELLGHHPRLALAREVAQGHHERWDGTGYPRGLAGARIPLGARIVALCDVYEALRARRPYREPLDHDAAVAVVTGGDWRTSPEHFDPAVLAAFRAIHPRFRELHQARPG